MSDQRIDAAIGQYILDRMLSAEARVRELQTSLDQLLSKSSEEGDTEEQAVLGEQLFNLGFTCMVVIDNVLLGAFMHSDQAKAFANNYRKATVVVLK